MRVSRRTIIARLLGAMILGVAATTVKAQGNGNGGGNGNGNGGGNGNGNGNGGDNGNGNSGNGNGNGGKGGGGKGKGSASAGLSADTSPANPASYASVVHGNGISESIADGHYEMHDAKGRLIIRRQATVGDVSRLRSER